ncbi:PEPxxWA-CTERM sorting domain-containing protein [Sphingomonas sp.]|jgi:hypothetical protein|uniref:PEPxxWA-CTERM sorting domain-containing protein n=1 Tax=Sphingomonas sp. TaxID=28214 RepID=UPI002DEFDC5C|nr:PEPxxWA-CTERM sorting domain-containing protein [Sphingomonas sp.]
MSRVFGLSCVIALSALGAPAQGATADADDDFIPTFAGTPVQELDIRSVDARLKDGVFRLSVTTDAPIGQTSSSYYVWGINRGAGAPRLQFVGAPPSLRPDLNFDAIFITYADQSAEFSLLPPSNFVNLAGAVQISGNTLTALLPLAMLPSNGFAPWQYEFTVWSHFNPIGPISSANNARIADFSPTIRAAIPEPSSWAMMIAGFGLLGTAARRRQSSVAFA